MIHDPTSNREKCTNKASVKTSEICCSYVVLSFFRIVRNVEMSPNNSVNRKRRKFAKKYQKLLVGSSLRHLVQLRKVLKLFNVCLAYF